MLTRFVWSACPLKRNLHKALSIPFFLGTSLAAALTRMSLEKVVPARLKHQECKCWRGCEKAPIRYVPEQDPVQEALDMKPKFLKCTFDNGSETWVTVWLGYSTNKHFVLHVNKVYTTAKKMRLHLVYDNVKKAHDSKKGKLKAVLSDPWIKLKREKRPQSHFCWRRR